MKKYLIVFLILFTNLFSQERILFSKFGNFTEFNSPDSLIIMLTGNDLNAELVFKICINDSFRIFKFGACDDKAMEYDNFDDCQKDIFQQIHIYKKGKFQTINQKDYFSKIKPKDPYWVNVGSKLWCEPQVYEFLKDSYEKYKLKNQTNFIDFVDDLFFSKSRTVIPVWGTNESIFDVVWSNTAKDIIIIWSPYY